MSVLFKLAIKKKATILRFTFAITFNFHYESRSRILIYIKVMTKIQCSNSLLQTFRKEDNIVKNHFHPTNYDVNIIIKTQSLQCIRRIFFFFF